jgi:hypothetical protein
MTDQFNFRFTAASSKPRVAELGVPTAAETTATAGFS